MPSFDSIVVGEDWISEHYFTTDSTKESFQSEVLKLRKQWDEQAKEGQESVLKRFLGERGTFQVELAELLEQPSKASDVYLKVREALGFKGTTADLTAERAGTTLRVPNVWESHNGDVLFLESRPVESLEDLLDSSKGRSRMLAPAFIDDKEAELPAPKLVSELYRTDEPPQFIVIFGGRWLLLTERERWAEGRFLAADMLLACERNDTKRGGEVDRVLAIFGRESLLPDASETIWWNQILESSVKHTIGVSKDLREGIRLSIEIIANDVLRRREVRGLPLDEVDGQILARQSLRYLYRILFLLYAEASPEMGVLPVGVGEYDKGYGLDRLRELTLSTLNSPQGRSGTHFYQSLNTLFRLVDQGHHPSVEGGTTSVELVEATPPAGGSEGLHFDSLRADLFDPEAMMDIDRVGLGNFALQKVLQHLLLSKEVKGRDRGFISYAELGVNQLGAVYEGLMSYTGFIAEGDLYEVAKDGDSSKGSWVVPVERSESIDRKHFVMAENDLTGELEPVLHEKGTFVFRLAGRERQQSASYYTPEVLTRFVVSQALEELLDLDGTTTAADDILKLSVCEPALGSGAFAIEAVRQLADEYLKRKQKERDEQIPAEAYAVELQKVKAQIALHQVYGVDLNSTAVELAEVSLWLDTMVAGLHAPWFGLHLRRGNSLIGARRATYSRAAVNDKSWLSSVPTDAALSGLAAAMSEDADDPNVVGRIHHFLLPAAGWGAAAEAKEVKDLAGDAQKELKAWRNRIKAKPSKAQMDRLVNLGRRVETLWQFSLRRLEVAESEALRHINYFGKGSDSEPAGIPVSRADIEQKLRDPNGAYQRLRQVMDAWISLWFWPLTDEATDGAKPPTLEEWIGGLESILGTPPKDSRMRGQKSFAASATWQDLNDAEELDLAFSQAEDIAKTLAKHRWLTVCRRVSADHGFFHWELDFASVFARGGFDLQVGNPPWVRPMFDEAAILAEGNPWWQLSTKPSVGQKTAMRRDTLAVPRVADLLIGSSVDSAATKAYLGDVATYPLLAGLQSDLYRCFIERTWRSNDEAGVVALIHPGSHYTEEDAHVLRTQAFLRLRRHWQFINELVLFEIDHKKTYGVHVYSSRRSTPSFLMAASLYHPDTVERSLRHDGNGPEPGLKDDDGAWDLRPHKRRILRVDEKLLSVWARLLDEPGTPPIRARMAYPVNSASSSALAKLASLPRIRDEGFEFSSGWHESEAQKLGFMKVGSNINDSWSDVILQGPHFTNNTPLVKQPNETMKNNQDWYLNDLESMEPQFVPRTSYQPATDRTSYIRGYTQWSSSRASALDYYRLAWRRMMKVGNERSMHCALIPPGAAHVDAVMSAIPSNFSARSTVVAAALFSSMPVDFLVKVAAPPSLAKAFVNHLPFVMGHPLEDELILRTLRLNCITEEFGQLWKECFKPAWLESSWSNEIMGNRDSLLSAIQPSWQPNSPLRLSAARRLAQVEIDVIVGIMFDLSADELCTIYRTQFPVLRGYEMEQLFDRAGRAVPTDVRRNFAVKAASLSTKERTATNADGKTYTYELPFVGLDREADMRQAHAHFTKLMEEKN